MWGDPGMKPGVETEVVYYSGFVVGAGLCRLPVLAGGDVGAQLPRALA